MMIGRRIIVKRQVGSRAEQEALDSIHLGNAPAPELARRSGMTRLKASALERAQRFTKIDFALGDIAERRVSMGHELWSVEKREEEWPAVVEAARDTLARQANSCLLLPLVELQQKGVTRVREGGVRHGAESLVIGALVILAADAAGAEFRREALSKGSGRSEEEKAAERSELAERKAVLEQEREAILENYGELFEGTAPVTAEAAAVALHDLVQKWSSVSA
jgi:hypothetical protein